MWVILKWVGQWIIKACLWAVKTFWAPLAVALGTRYVASWLDEADWWGSDIIAGLVDGVGYALTGYLAIAAIVNVPWPLLRAPVEWTVNPFWMTPGSPLSPFPR